MAKAKKRKLKVKRRLTAREWCKTGHQFEMASHALLYGREAMFELLGIPHLVLRSFAVECFLKCLIELDNREAEWEHNFELLFDDIPKSDQKALRKLWGDEYTPMMRKWNVWKDRPWKRRMPVTLRGALRQCGDAFIVIRYGPSEKKYPFALMNFPLRMQDYIWEKRPDFKPPRDPLIRNPKAQVVKPEHQDLAAIFARAAELNRQGAGPLSVVFRAADAKDRGPGQGR